MRTRMSVNDVSTLTLATHHAAYPVTDPVPPEEEGKHFGRLRGMVYSRDLATKFFNKFFDDRPNTLQAETWERYVEAYPRFFKPHEVWRHDPESELQSNHHIDLSNIMDVDVHTVCVTSTLEMLFDTFVNESLRHLVVVDQERNVLGIVTRKDLASLCGK